MSEFLYGKDTQEEIDKCLECEKEECDDCLGEEELLEMFGGYYKPIDESSLTNTKKEVLRLYKLGWNDVRIATELGVVRTTVGNARESMRLPTMDASYDQDDRKEMIERWMKLSPTTNG